jgi:16S rRNA (guanine527-N7)-methyltransferase
MSAGDETAPESDTLAAALARHNIALSPEQTVLLDRYRALLWQWNEKLNLTRHTTLEKFVGRDVVDSLAFSGVLAAGEDVLDVGTGGGVPGVILAVARPDLSVSLCEPVGKKARAVSAMLQELGLSLPVHSVPVQKLLEDQVYDALLVRAVAPLADLLRWVQPHWGHVGRLLVLKGPRWVEERHAAREAGLLRGFDLRKLHAYPLPGTESESVLLQIAPRQG